MVAVPVSDSTTALVDGTSAADAPRSSSASVPPFSLLLGLFFVSGVTALIDQLCYSKYLSYVVGATAYAVSAVLAAFMAGLAIGAHFGGRLSARVRRPLAAYGAAELLVSGAVALSPLAFGALTPFYVSLVHRAPHSLAAVSFLRWLLALLLVIVPTTAMGATLPMLARHLAHASPGSTADGARWRESRLGALYAVNTLGGAGGALAAAYFVLPALGISHTLEASALASAAVGATAIVLGLMQAPRSAPDAAVEVVEGDGAAAAAAPELDEPDRAERWLLLGLAFASGWLVFAAEVVFTHLLALIIGNSAYAFGLILAVFLVCLFFAAARAAWFHERLGRGALPLGLALTAAALVATLPGWDWLPLMFAHTGKVLTSFAGREALRALAAFLILCLPATLMGLTFPLLLQRIARHARVGQWVGRLTAVNTIGAVVGSLVTGYVVLPWLGSQHTLVAMAVAFAAAAVVTDRLSARARSRAPSRRASAMVLAFAAAGALGALLLPRWNLARLTSGTNVYFDGGQAAGKILMLKEDVHGGVTSVMTNHGVTTLYTNGKFQGNTGWEMHAQRLFAHYPSLFVHDYDHALVIGLGTGTTLGALTAYPWKRLDVAEISPSIVVAAHRYFTAPNRDALDDPRVHVHHADGRNYLLVSQQRYDLICMELTSVWFAGASNLYSREYYALVRQHLQPGGIFQQWVQLHHIYRRDLATILHTLRLEFAHVALFLGGGQGILVASEQPLVASRAELVRLAERPGVRATVPNDRTLPSLLDDVLVVDQGLDRFVQETADMDGVPLGTLVSSDDNLYLEYATPRGNVLPWSAREALVAELEKFRDPTAIDAMLGP
jgi:spermidine synthase